jgi:hypothetical protein
MEGKVLVKLPDGILANDKQQFELDISAINIDNPFISSLQLNVVDSEHWFARNGEVTLQFTNRIACFPLSAIIYDSSAKPSIDVDTQDGRVLHSLTMGEYTIAVSPDYIASLVRFGRTGEDSVFYDTFPKSNPFMWWSNFYTGINPAVAGWDIWDWESAFHKEEWVLTESNKEPWVGFEMSSVAKHSPGLRGLEFHIKYLLLQGTPLVYATLKVVNKSRRRKTARLYIRGVPRPGGTIQNRIHTVFNEQQIIYEPRDVEADLPSSPKHGWVAFENPVNGKIVGMVSNERTRESIVAINMGENADMFVCHGLRSLKPGEKSAISCFIVLPDSSSDMTLLNKLSTNFI